MNRPKILLTMMTSIDGKIEGNFIHDHNDELGNYFELQKLEGNQAWAGGQILVAVGGAGYYQERGKKAVRMEEDDVIEIAQNVEHWHGAAPDSWFAYLSIICNPQINENTWLELVPNEEYADTTK